VSQNRRHGRDDLGQPGTEPLQCPPVGTGENLLDNRLIQVAQYPVLREELVTAGGPGVVLDKAAEVAVMGPAEPVVDGAMVEGGEVVRERLPLAAAIAAWLQRLQQEHPAGDRQDVGSRQPTGAQRGQALSLDPEQVFGRAGQGLAHDAAAVGVGD
jgi:hypothetical protein